MENKVKVLKNGTVFGDLEVGECFVENYNGAEYTIVYMKTNPITDDNGAVFNSVILNDGYFASWADEELVTLVDIMIEARM